eukprot:2073379-Ditylum_brightwellii.AAC.1
MQEAKLEYTPKQPCLCPKMHWDIKQHLIAVISMYTTLDWLKEVIHDGEDVLDKGTQPNEAAVKIHLGLNQGEGFKSTQTKDEPRKRTTQ